MASSIDFPRPWTSNSLFRTQPEDTSNFLCLQAHVTSNSDFIYSMKENSLKLESFLVSWSPKVFYNSDCCALWLMKPRVMETIRGLAKSSLRELTSREMEMETTKRLIGGAVKGSCYNELANNFLFFRCSRARTPPFVHHQLLKRVVCHQLLASSQRLQVRRWRYSLVWWVDLKQCLHCIGPRKFSLLHLKLDKPPFGRGGASREETSLFLQRETTSLQSSLSSGVS